MNFVAFSIGLGSCVLIFQRAAALVQTQVSWPSLDLVADKVSLLRAKEPGGFLTESSMAKNNHERALIFDQSHRTMTYTRKAAAYSERRQMSAET